MSYSKLRQFLDQHNVKYLVISHPVAYTARRRAAVNHLPGKELTKAVMIRVDGRLAMAALPAACWLDLPTVQERLGAAAVHLASEAEFRHRFTDCEAGAIPPFGNLYGMDVFAEETLACAREITFNASSHSELMRMAFADFRNLVKPALFPLATKTRVRGARVQMAGVGQL